MSYYYYQYRQQPLYLVVPDAKRYEKQIVDLQMKSTGQVFRNAYIISVIDVAGPSYGSVTFIPAGQNLPISTTADDILFIGPAGSLPLPPSPMTQPPPTLSTQPGLQGWPISRPRPRPRPPYYGRY